MEAFQRHPSIDVILVATLDSWKEVSWVYAKLFCVTKLKWIITGRETDQDSIRKGLKKLKEEYADEDVTVIVHDGNRPLVTSEVISDSLATFAKCGNAVAVVPCTGVIFESDNGFSSYISTNREMLFRTQIPHTYRLSDLL